MQEQPCRMPGRLRKELIQKCCKCGALSESLVGGDLIESVCGDLSESGPVMVITYLYMRYIRVIAHFLTFS